MFYISWVAQFAEEMISIAMTQDKINLSGFSRISPGEHRFLRWISIHFSMCSNFAIFLCALMLLILTISMVRLYYPFIYIKHK